MSQIEIPTPQITSRPDGHWAVCPACGAQSEVPVTEREPVTDKEKREATFVLASHPDGSEDYAYGTVAEHDLSAYEAHYASEHGEA